MMVGIHKKREAKGKKRTSDVENAGVRDEVVVEDEGRTTTRR